MNTFSILLILAALGCALVAGIALIFAVVVMPGLRTLGDRAYLAAFKAIDRVIQNNQPVFMLVWLGSVLALIASTVFGLGRLEGLEAAVLIAALAAYVLGVQVPTAVVNVPLNNRLQGLDIERLDDAAIAEARAAFEPRWIRWNAIRTVVATLVAASLMWLLSRL